MLAQMILTKTHRKAHREGYYWYPSSIGYNTIVWGLMFCSVLR